MTILDALGNAEYRQHITLLATLIKLAYADGKIDPAEWALIRSVALRYGLDDDEGLKYLKKNYEKYSLDTPFELEERIEQLYDLARLVFADGKADEKELKILRTAVIGLGFQPAKADLIFEAAVNRCREGVGREAFIRYIKDLLS
ncbi:MAG: hypothetical protein GXO24_02550 [Chlorobi bacterium]|nr:hypothetical protein [Chlorobiota bacterium]